MTYRENEKMSMYLSSEGRTKDVNGEQQPHDENNGDDDDDHDDDLGGGDGMKRFKQK